MVRPTSHFNLNTMVFLSKFICVYTLILLIKPIFPQQFYDNSNCTSELQFPGSNYLCNTKTGSCRIFVVYRAQEGYQTLSSISSLFNTNISKLLSLNEMTKGDSSTLLPGREIVIPITCRCSNQFSQDIQLYNATHSDSMYTIACGVFEGLAKAQSLIEHNTYLPSNSLSNHVLKVPVRCACPNTSDTNNGINYLVTYPVIEDDQTDLIARKFGVPERMIWDANRLDQFTTIFPQTTLLIPTMGVPILNTNVSGDPAPGPQPVIPLNQIIPGKKTSNKKIYVFLVGGIVAIIALMVIAWGVPIQARKRSHPGGFKTLLIRNSPVSKFSPDFLDGMSKLKHSLVSFSLEELRIATEDFSEASVIGTAVYRGRIGGSHVAIERMKSEEEARHMMDILTKINHLNVVKLEGCSYGSTTYLVFEYAENGSLRDCLSNSKLAKQFTWKKRLRIGFDLAVGLHYIHYSTKPSYVHRNINSKNVLVTVNWRAKISGFRLVKPVIYSEEKEESNWNESEIVGRKGYLAPGYLDCGKAATKVDVYAFGVVLLELLSAKEAIAEGVLLKNCVGFLADGGLEDSSGCLDKLKGFMDPVLEGDYPLGDAMFLALLAKACVEEYPLHRPTMNDLLKALSRFL
ncbi:unnamed protein product [Ilex paraguariensis]|uniref:LysM domain receptor-like kinase 4 n=1 Tax=Ilex paraguariensis TaxID=185542 RepID=A0ABC8QXQ8_9AQUA